MAARTHGLSRTCEYHAWVRMFDRCTNPEHPSWQNYGGRGITVDPSWLSFEAFYIDMWPRSEGCTLDRIDNDGPYSALNCRWATRSVQQRNQRKKTGTSSRFRGVCWDKDRQKWQAHIRLEGVQVLLGRFDTEEAAAQAYDQARG